MGVHGEVAGSGGSRYNFRPRKSMSSNKSPKSRVNKASKPTGRAKIPNIGKKFREVTSNLEEMSEDEDAYDVDSIFRFDPKYANECQALSEAGLRRYNNDNEPDLQMELVKAGFAGLGNIGNTVIAHVNFKARGVGDIDNVIYMMFAQVRRPSAGRYVSNKRIVDFCFVLGEVDHLPEEPYVGGCLYCHGTSVHHPYYGKKRLLTGCYQDDESWLPHDWKTNVEAPEFPPYPDDEDD